MSSKSASKGKAPARSASPTADLEYFEASDTVPNQDVAPSGKNKNRSAVQQVDEEDEVSESLIIRIRDAARKLRDGKFSSVSAAEIAEEIGESEDKVKGAQRSLKLARAAKKQNAYRKAARKAGGSAREGGTYNEISGTQFIAQPMLTESDITRAAHMVMQGSAEMGSYGYEEGKMRIELMHDTLPKTSARLILSEIEPMFRSIITDAVKRQTNKGTQRVVPSTVLQTLERYSNGVFTGTTAPDGLVRFVQKDKQNVEFLKRGDNKSGRLMKASNEDNKRFREQAAANAKLDTKLEKKIQDEKDRMIKKRESDAAKSKKDAEDDAEDGAVDDPEEEVPKKKKKKKNAVAA